MKRGTLKLWKRVLLFMLASVYILSALLGTASDSLVNATSVQNTSQMISAEKVLFYANHKSKQDEFYPQLTQLPIEYFQVYGTFISNYYDPWNTILNNLQDVEGNNTSDVIKECIEFFKTIGFTEDTATTVVNGLWNMALDSRVPLRIYSSKETDTIMSESSGSGKAKDTEKFKEVKEQADNDGACSYVDFLTYMGSWGRDIKKQYYCVFEDGGTKKVGFSSSIRRKNTEFLSSTKDYKGLSSHTASSLAYAIVNGYLNYNAGVGDSLTVLTKENSGAAGARQQSENLITDSKMFIDCFGNITCEFAGNVFVVVPGCVNPYTWTTIEDDEGTAGGQRLPLNNLFMIGRQIADGKSVSGSATLTGYSNSGSSVDLVRVKPSSSSKQSNGDTRMSLFTRGKSPMLGEQTASYVSDYFYYPQVTAITTGVGGSARLTATGMWRLFRYSDNISGEQKADSDLNALNPDKDTENDWFAKPGFSNTDFSWMGEAGTPLAKAILSSKNKTVFKPPSGSIATEHPMAQMNQSLLTDTETGVTNGLMSIFNNKIGLTNAKSILNFVFPTWYGSQPVATLDSDKFISDMLYFDNYNLYDTTTDAPSTIKANPTGVFGGKTGTGKSLNPRVSSANATLPVEYDEFGNSSSYGNAFFEQAKSKSKGYALSLFATYLASDKLLATKGFQASSGGTSTSTGTGKFKAYNFTDDQIKGIAAACMSEQGSTKAGAMLEASILLNLCERDVGDSPSEQQIINYLCHKHNPSKYADTGKYKGSGWFASAAGKSYEAGYNVHDGASGGKPTDEILKGVKSILNGGKRTIPPYIDEHDALSDLTSDTLASKGSWKPHETILKNKMGSSYYFYGYPVAGGDPYGYTTNEGKKKKDAVGEGCYDVNGNWLPNGLTDSSSVSSTSTTTGSNASNSSSSSTSTSTNSSTSTSGTTTSGTTYTLVDINGTWTPDVSFRFNRSGLPKAVCNSSWNWAPANGDGTDKVLNDIKNWVWYILNPVKGLNYLRVWFKNKVSSLLVDIHFDIVGYGNGVNVGATKYVGFAGYTTTPSLRDMEWTDKILQIYDSLFVFIVVIVAIILLGYVIVGQLSIQRAIIGVLIFAICAYIPPTVINGVIDLSNQISDNVYSDKFMYWALVNHESYVAELNSSYEDYSNAILENSNAWFSTSVDDDNEATAGRNNGATSAIALKWMNPKTFTYQNKSNSGFGDVVTQDDEVTVDATTDVEEGTETPTPEDESTENSSDTNDVTSVADTMVSGAERRVLSQEVFAENTTADYLYRNYSDIAAHSMYLYNNMLLNKDAFRNNSGHSALVRKVTSDKYEDVSDYLEAYNESVKLDFNNSTSGRNVMRFAPIYQGENEVLYNALEQDLSSPSYSESYGINSSTDLNFSIGEVNQNTNSGTYYEKDGLFEYILTQESPFYYFSWNFYDQGMTTTSSGTYATLLTDTIVDGESEESDEVKTASSGYFYCNSDDSLAFGQTKDYLDMKTLFTVVIPMYKQLNDKVVEYRERYGMTTYDIEDVPEGDRGSDELEFKKWHNKNVEDLWSIWCPWVAQLYEGKYAEPTTVKVAGKAYLIEDPLNPVSYPEDEGRPMIFSRAEQMYYGLSDRDLTEVEKRIIAVEEKSVTDMYNLLNYYTFNDTVMTTAAAMQVTFNFNREFSEASLLSGGATLYPTSFELKNFGYDAYLRMIMATATGEDLLNSDLYLTIVRDSSIFTALFMIINDLVVVYGISFIKILFVLLIFGLSVITVLAAAIKLEIDIIKVLWNSLFGPLLKFLLISVGHAYIISFFMKGGNVSVTDTGKFYISMGDPAMTLVFLTVVNVVLCILYYKLLKTGVLDFIKYVKMITASVGGMVTGIGVKFSDAAGLSGRSLGAGAAGAGAVALGVLGAKGLERGAGNKAPNATKNSPQESEATKAQAKSHKSKNGDVESVNSKISSGESKVNGGNGVGASPTGSTSTEESRGSKGTSTRATSGGSTRVVETPVTPMKGESIARDVTAHNRTEKREVSRKRVRSEAEMSSSRRTVTPKERNEQKIKDYEGRLNKSDLGDKQSRELKSEVNTRRGRASQEMTRDTHSSRTSNGNSRKEKVFSAEYSQARRRQVSGKRVGDVSPNPRR